MITSVYQARGLQDTIINFIGKVGVPAAGWAATLYVLHTTVKENTAALIALRIVIARALNVDIP